jgi:hypothetical protein
MSNAMAVTNNTITLETQRQIRGSDSNVGLSISRLSSGIRINTARDDPAGFAIALAFKSDTVTISSRGQAAANDGVEVSEAQANLASARDAMAQFADSSASGVAAKVSAALHQALGAAGQGGGASSSGEVSGGQQQAVGSGSVVGAAGGLRNVGAYLSAAQAGTSGKTAGSSVQEGASQDLPAVELPQNIVARQAAMTYRMAAADEKNRQAVLAREQESAGRPEEQSLPHNNGAIRGNVLGQQNAQAELLAMLR